MLPKTLYELKPTLCVVAGAVAGMTLELAVGKLAAVLSITAGVLAFNLRLIHRGSNGTPRRA